MDIKRERGSPLSHQNFFLVLLANALLLGVAFVDEYIYIYIYT
jgi:hypothetical protein